MSNSQLTITIALAVFIVAVAAEPKVDSIVPEQLAQVGEDRTCTNVDIKFRLPQGGYYTVDMTQETIDKIKADAKSGDEMDELTMTSVKQTVKQGATTEAAAKAVAMTGSNIDMKMDGPIAETQTTAKEVVMVPARVTRQDWPIMPKTAIHNFYDQDSIDCCGGQTDKKVDSLDDCVDLCAKHKECRGVSWRKNGKTHQHYKKCFFVTYDGGKHWDNSCTGGACDFETAVKSPQMIQIPVGPHTPQNAVSLKAYAKLVIDEVEDEDEGSLGALADILKAIAVGMPGPLPSFATYVTAMQNNMETVTSTGGLQAYVLNAIIAGMKSDGGIVSVSGPYAGITGSTLGLTEENMSDPALKSIQVHSPKFINAAIKIAKDEAKAAKGTGGGTGANADPAVKKATAPALSEEDAAKLYNWHGNVVVPGAAVMQVASLDTMATATTATATTATATTASEELVSTMEVADCDPKSRQMGETDSWWQPENGGNVADKMVYQAAMAIAHVGEVQGALLDDIYKRALAATKAVGGADGSACSAPMHVCYAATAAREFVKDKRQAKNLIKTYEPVVVIDVTAHPEYAAAAATVTEQQEVLLEQIKSKYDIKSADLSMEIVACK